MRAPQRVSVLRPVTEKVQGVAVPGATTTVQSRIAAEVRVASESRLSRVFAASVQAIATHVVKIHKPRSWRVLMTDQLVLHDDVTKDDRTLHIVGLADPDGRNRELLIAGAEHIA